MSAPPQLPPPITIDKTHPGFRERQKRAYPLWYVQWLDFVAVWIVFCPAWFQARYADWETRELFLVNPAMEEHKWFTWHSHRYCYNSLYAEEIGNVAFLSLYGRRARYWDHRLRVLRFVQAAYVGGMIQTGSICLAIWVLIFLPLVWKAWCVPLVLFLLSPLPELLYPLPA